MDALKRYLSSHPQNLDDWLDQFPWENFDAEITIHEDKVEKIVIAKKVTLHNNAEITGLLICHEADIGEGAEILGTMVCDKGVIGQDAECNYFMGRIAVFGEDAEIRSAIISDSLKMENGAEIDELEILESTFADLHGQSLIKKKTKLPVDGFNKAISQRLQIILESIISQSA